MTMEVHSTCGKIALALQKNVTYKCDVFTNTVLEDRCSTFNNGSFKLILILAIKYFFFHELLIHKTLA
jgi:hypothetical protein